MFNLSKLFNKAESYFSEMGLAGAVGGSAALYAMGVTRDTTSLLVLTAASAAPHILGKYSNFLAGATFDVIGMVVPFITMNMLGLLTLRTGMIFTAGAMIGGVAGGAIATTVDGA